MIQSGKELPNSRIGFLIVGVPLVIVAARTDLLSAQPSETRLVRKPSVTALAATPDGTGYLAGSQAGVVGGSLRDEADWSVATRLSHINVFAFSNNGDVLAVGGGSPAVSGVVELWSWPDRKRLISLEGHGDLVNAVAWLPNGAQTLATASSDGTLRIWNAVSGQCLETLAGHSAPVLAAAASHDGQWLCSGGVDQTIRVWNTQTWQMQRTLNNHLGAVHDLAFQPGVVEGQPVCLASAGQDGTVRIWYPEIGRMVRIIRHRVPVFCLAWTSGGSQLCSGSADGCVRMLTGERQRVTDTRQLTEGWIVSLAACDPTKQLLAGTSQGKVKFTPIDPLVTSQLPTR